MPTETTCTVSLYNEPFTVSLNTKWDRQFWISYEDNWETDTFAFVKEHVSAGTVFLDIGAWIGPIALYAARLGAKVVALEPDPTARQALEQNVALNGLDVEVIPAGLSSSDAGLTLFGGSRGLGASTTSSLGVDFRHRVRAQSIDVQNLLSRVEGRQTVVKIDIEGHEYRIADEIAQLWRTTSAPMHFSLHPRPLRKQYARRLSFHPTKKAVEATAQCLQPYFGHAEFADTREILTESSLRTRLGETSQTLQNFEIVVASANAAPY